MLTLTVTQCNAHAAGFWDGVTFATVLLISLTVYAVRRNYQKKDKKK